MHTTVVAVIPDLLSSNVLYLNCPMLVITPPHLLPDIIPLRPKDYPTHFIGSDDNVDTLIQHNVSKNPFKSKYFVHAEAITQYNNKWNTLPWPDPYKIRMLDRTSFIFPNIKGYKTLDQIQSDNISVLGDESEIIYNLATGTPFVFHPIPNLNVIASAGINTTLKNLGYSTNSESEYTLVINDPTVRVYGSAMELMDKLSWTTGDIIIAGQREPHSGENDYFFDIHRESPHAYPYPKLMIGKTKQIEQITKLLREGITIETIMKEHHINVRIDYNATIFAAMDDDIIYNDEHGRYTNTITVERPVIVWTPSISSKSLESLESSSNTGIVIFLTLIILAIIVIIILMRRK